MRLLRLLAVAALLASVAGPAAAQPDPDENVIRVDVRAMTTALTTTTPSLQIHARAVNTSTDPVRRLRIALRFGQPLLGRSAVAAAPDPGRLGFRVAEQAIGEGELAPGGTAETDFDVPVAKLPFHRARGDGIYPMRIEVRSRFEVVGTVDTYVMWWPNASPMLRIAWIWPLVEPSHRALGDDFFDDGLGNSVDGGRLDALLRIGSASPAPITWAVDPETVDSVQRMTGPYTVRGEPGTDATVAKAWLERARTALRDADFVGLPYADPDLATTATGALAADAGRAFNAGRTLLKRDLGRAGDSTLAWPPGSTLDPAVESLLAGQGVHGVVIPESALPLTERLNYTPSAPTQLTSDPLGSLTALVSDTQLDGWVAAKTGTEGPRIAAQRFLADTAMTALERPHGSRDVVVTPPRTWEPVSGFAEQLLAQTALAPWLQPATLGQVLADEPSAAPRTLTPSNGGLLHADHVRHVVDLRRRLQRLRGILTDPQREPAALADLDDALARAVSAAWAHDTTGGIRLADTADAGLARQLDRLRVVTGGVVTMTGRSGRIPLTFQNDLGQTVRIRVRIDTNKRLRLEGGTPYEARTGAEVVIPPGGSTLVIKGKATTGGLFSIKVDLLATDGRPLGIGTTLKVRSTAYGVVALTVTGVAFGLLLVASATRLVKRGRKPSEPTPEPATV